MRIPRPGEIYWAYGESDRPHPYIVVSREVLNRGDYFLGVQLTSSLLESRTGLPNCVPFQPGQFGLMKACVAQAESLTILRKADVDWTSGPVGTLDGVSMRNLIRSIGYVISAECEPA